MEFWLNRLTFFVPAGMLSIAVSAHLMIYNSDNNSIYNTLNMYTVDS